MEVTSARSTRAVRVAVGVVLGSLLLGSLAFALTLPVSARIPIHFDARFQADSWTGPLGLGVLPMAAVVSVLSIYGILPRDRVSYIRREWLALLVSCVLAIAQLHVVLSTLGESRDLSAPRGAERPAHGAAICECSQIRALSVRTAPT